jgi:hypothetical protein
MLEIAVESNEQLGRIGYLSEDQVAPTTNPSAKAPGLMIVIPVDRSALSLFWLFSAAFTNRRCGSTGRRLLFSILVPQTARPPSQYKCRIFPKFLSPSLSPLYKGRTLAR